MVTIMRRAVVSAESETERRKCFFLAASLKVLRFRENRNVCWEQLKTVIAKVLSDNNEAQNYKLILYGEVPIILVYHPGVRDALLNSKAQGSSTTTHATKTSTCRHTSIER